jgi:hypothetical protein
MSPNKDVRDLSGGDCDTLKSDKCMYTIKIKITLVNINVIFYFWNNVNINFGYIWEFFTVLKLITFK